MIKTIEQLEFLLKVNAANTVGRNPAGVLQALKDMVTGERTETDPMKRYLAKRTMNKLVALHERLSQWPGSVSEQVKLISPRLKQGTLDAVSNYESGMERCDAIKNTECNRASLDFALERAEAYNTFAKQYQKLVQ